MSTPHVVAVGSEHGQRLDNFLLRRLKGLPKSRVYRMVRRGEVRVNGGRTRPSYRVQSGDEVRIPPFRPAEPDEATAKGAPLRRVFDDLLANALYQDDDLLVIHKPSGIAVHGGSGIAFGVVETLRHFDPATRYELAHRLDRDTSGCLLLVKNRRALLRLHQQFRTGGVRKRYDLIVAGDWPARRRTATEPLQRYVLASGERRVRVATDGEPARTDFAIVTRLNDATWLAAFPKTGRTHQIRVHAAVAGHPILGDTKYGRKAAAGVAGKAGANRLLLHASALTISIGDRRQRFEAPLPAAFAAFVERRR